MSATAAEEIQLADMPQEATMKSSGQRGEADTPVEPVVEPRKSLMHRVFGPQALAFMATTLMVSIGIAAFTILVTHCDHGSGSGSELIHAEHVVSEAAHQLIMRGQANDADAVFAVAANPMVTKAAGSGTGLVTSVRPIGTSGNVAEVTISVTVQQPSITQTVASWTAKTAREEHTQTKESGTTPLGVSVPISTQTALSTIYSIMSSDVTDFITMTTTATTTVTRHLPKTTEEEVCVASTATMTVSVYVTLSPVPEETVTGDASTVTDVSTHLSLTHGLPDVTLSGNPSTQTELQTDVSVTTGLPDATVSGGGQTQTAVQTDVSLTSGLPDATVTGKPSTVSDVKSSTASQSVVSIFTTVVITDFWGTFNPSQTPTTTATASSEATLTITVTVSDLGDQGVTTSASDASSVLADFTTGSSTSTNTKTVTVIKTADTYSAASIFTTVRVPPVMNATTAGGVPAWTSAAGVPVVVSEGTKMPEPKGWAVGNNCGNLGCTIMLIAIIMLVL
ncbi:hypothetical protein XA68_16707 [Ophiocordyceps unilateralis]|uniref:Uncharacterized protein n=1 Tax=Ophiocordyceps unilateralis TaxID=268505 RepID=A0A2A9P655_OPHUN|nr:hypothetical protein XA68_16707 [Ophiocordyceps unilateralis]